MFPILWNFDGDAHTCNKSGGTFYVYLLCKFHMYETMSKYHLLKDLAQRILQNVSTEIEMLTKKKGKE